MTKNNFKILPTFVLVSMSVLQSQTQQINYYVSPISETSMHIDGSMESPFTELEQARDHIREHQKTHENCNYTVYLRKGIHFRNTPFILESVDSPTPGNKIEYTALPGETPILSGGTVIEGWQPHENGVWKAPIKGKRFRQLYINNKKAIRARHPNTNEFYRIEERNIEDRYVTIPTPFAKRWNQFENIEMHVTLLWAEAILRLKSFTTDPENPEFTQVRFQEPESELVFKRHWPRFVPNQAFHFENAYEFIDHPGEWYIDEAEDTLYYLPHKGEDLRAATVIAPVQETLISIGGTVESPVSGVTLSKLTFSHTNWLRPSKAGHLHMQAGQYTVEPTYDNVQYVGRTPAAVNVNFAEAITFKGNTFTQLGNTALDLHHGVNGTIIEGNLFYKVSATAIQLGEFTPPEQEIHVPWNPDDKRLICKNNRIANNYIRQIGHDYPGSCGVAAGYVQDLLIEHNEITHLPYTAISVGWGWTDAPSPLQDNIIRYNHISHIMRELTDGGGIYTLSLQPGTQIYHNHIHDAKLTPKSHDPKSLHSRGIYLDEASGGTASKPFLVSENAVYRTTQDYRFHIVGTIIHDGNLDYQNPAPISNQRRPGREIAELAGLQVSFEHLRKAMNYDTFPKRPNAHEKLSRRQMEMRNKTLNTQQIVMTTELIDDPEKIQEYEFYHSKEGVWPEVIDAAKISGIESIKIHRFQNRLFMVIDLPIDANADEVFSTYDNSSNRIKDWAEIMSSLQRALPGLPEDQKWSVMKTIHDYAHGEVR